MAGSHSSLRCLTSCKLREYCHAPTNCALWATQSLTSLPRRWIAPAVGAAALILAALAALRVFAR